MSEEDALSLTALKPMVAYSLLSEGSYSPNAMQRHLCQFTG